MQPPIYVINLDKSPERLTNTRERFVKVGMEITRLPGVLGSALTDDEIAEIYSARGNQHQFYRPLSKGEIGCYASHRKAWQQIANADSAFGIVVEDDIDVDSNFAEAMETLQNLSFTWDMIKLAPYQNKQRPVVYTQPVSPDFALTITNKTVTGCAAYALTKACAQRLLTSTKPFCRPVDTDLQHFWEHGIHIYNLSPYVIRQDMAYDSDIGHNRKAYGQRKWQKLKLQCMNFFRNKAATRTVIKALQNKTITK
jgi:glycosyl transferase family 25